MSKLRPALPLLLLPLVGACFLYTGGDDPCDDSWGGEADVAYIELRNPETGQCEAAGFGGGGGSSCGSATSDGARVPAPARDWAMCYAACSGLDEATCLATSECRGAYSQPSWCSDCEPIFYECWGTAPSGPAQGGQCAEYGAYECSRHDDCKAIHSSLEAAGEGGGFQHALGPFLFCAPERHTGDEVGCYEGDACAEGYTCNAAEICREPPGCWSDDASNDDSPGGALPCDICYGYCVPDDDPGSCVGDVGCRAAVPDCPPGTIPGVENGCWTGYCISFEDCDELPECPGLAEEPCVSRSDCSAFYEGIDCTCAGDSCTCSEWIYDGCDVAETTGP